MEKYEINKETAAIIGINKYSSKVVEKGKNYKINDSAYSVMENSCEYYGSTYNGRLKGSKNMLGLRYKVPIIVEESSDLIFFPITDIENPKCIWISLNWFDKVEIEGNTTYIYLKNGKKIPTKMSKYSIENQFLKSSKLHLILNNRKNSQK